MASSWPWKIGLLLTNWRPSSCHKNVLFLDDSTEAQSIRWSADSYRLDAIGQPVFTFYQRISRKAGCLADDGVG